MAPLKPLACSWTRLVGVGIRTIYKPTTQTAILEILHNEEILNYICVPNTCSVPSQRSWLSSISCPIVMGQYSHRGEAAGCIWRLYGLHAQNFPRTNESSHQHPPKALTVQKTWAFLGREALCRQGLLRGRQGLWRAQTHKRTKKKTKAALLTFAKTNVFMWRTGEREAKWQSAACPQQCLRNQ